jgi:DNA-directed RNA polymerase sigma subunit (sigma70/sigma32)
MTKPKTRRRKKNSRHYFTKDHEDAIVKYARSDDRDEKQKLYIDLIQPAFNELVNKIVYTYKFSSLPNIDVLMEECKMWLTTILDKYDPDKGSKAFSYFSVITKNWFIHKVKKCSTAMRREIQFDAVSKASHQRHLCMEDEGYVSNREYKEFWKFLKDEMSSWHEETLKQNERKVLKAVDVLFNSSEDIEIFNKKAVYLYLRELTGLNTKQVVSSLNKLRARYRNFKSDWNEGKI